MTVIALASVKSSPGVTTSLLALAATWPDDRPLLLLEADPHGGDLAARTGLTTDPGLTSLAAAGRHALPDGELDRHTQRLPGGLPVVVGPADAEQSTRALQVLGERLAAALRHQSDRDVVVDCGRLHPGSPAHALATSADRLVLVAQPQLDQLQHLRPLAARLTAADVRPVLLLIGDRPYAADEVAAALEIPVIATLPHDPNSADLLNGRLTRTHRGSNSSLLRVARAVGEQLADEFATASQGVRESAVSGETAPRRSTRPVRERTQGRNGHRERSGWGAVLTRPPTTEVD